MQHRLQPKYVLKKNLFGHPQYFYNLLLLFQVVIAFMEFEIIKGLVKNQSLSLLFVGVWNMSASTNPGSKMDSAMNGPNSRPNGPIPPAAYGPDALPDPQDLEDDPMSSLTAVSQMWMKFGKTFLVILPIYILGYFEFSFSWILVGLAAMFYWKRNYSTQDNHINRALRFLDHEEKVTKRNAATSQLPPWVSHFYRAMTPNCLFSVQTVKQMWPFISQFVEKLFRDTIEPAVKNATPYLSSFCFTKIDLGDKPLRVNGVKVYTENVDKRQVIMDLEVSFVGNTEIDIDIKKFYCRAGIKNIQLHGVLRVVMEPLLGDMPLIGALSVFFLKKPWLDINWTGLTNMLDIPGVNGLTDNLILDILCQHLVMPNKIKIPLVGDDQLAQLRFPVPKGVLRIHFLEAQDLLGKDKFLGGLIKGKSDPYGVLEVGTQLFKSKVINDTVNPKWNEVYEALIYDNSSWFDLEDVSQGKLHLKLEWLSLLPKPDKLDQVLSDIKAGQSKANDGLSSALLVVFLDSARNLPSGKKVTSDPSPFVQFRMGHKHFESKVRYKTNEPVWEEAFTFLVHNPRSQELEVEVRCDKQECSLGNLTVPLQSLLEAKDMTLEKHFALRTTGPTSTLKMKMALWVNSSSSSTPRPSISSDSALKTSSVSDTQDQTPRTPGAVSNGGDVFGMGLSQSNLNIAGSQLHLPGGKEPTPSIASDISNPLAEQELWNRVSQLHNGSSPFPLGEIQLTIRHSSQRNKLIVVVHSCRNLSAFTDHGSDPYVRLYLLPDKRRSGRRKTSTFKKNLNPVYDQTFEFSVSVVELHRRTLDVAVKNGGGLLSKHRGLLGKVI
uniref:Extended synaptotagmin-like protein 2a n=1 Tax=Neogobius melanostomus TaxID=47308 RepID=A0A8C6WVF2_9GOBI